MIKNGKHVKVCELCQITVMDKESILKTCSECADFIMDKLAPKYWDGDYKLVFTHRDTDYLSGNNPYCKSKL